MPDVLPAEKISEPLRQKLESAEADETITALVHAHLEEALESAESPLEARQFETQSAYRAALIEQRKRRRGPAVNTVQEALVALDLHPRGGESGTFIVHGKASAIFRAAQLSSVVRIDENPSLTLISPVEE